MKKLILAAVVAVSCATLVQPADAAKKKRLKDRSQYSSEQRHDIMTRARALCRKHYGATSRPFKIDYRRNRVMCSDYHG